MKKLQESGEGALAGNSLPAGPPHGPAHDSYQTETLSRSRLLAPLLETLATEDRPPLGRLKGDCGFLAALRARGAGLGFNGNLARRRRTQHGNSLRLADLAAFWLVLELFIVKEKLLACGEDEV